MKIEISEEYLRNIVRGLSRLLKEEVGDPEIAKGIGDSLCWRAIENADPKQLRKVLAEIGKAKKPEN